MMISIIMNARNSGLYINQAIDCVIKQTYKNWELIIWDNGSTDNTFEIIKEKIMSNKRIKYYYENTPTSLYNSRKEAFLKSNGNVIAFLDCDDLWDKNKLELQIKLFKDDKVGMSCTDYIIFYENKSWTNKYKKTYTFQKKSLNKILKNYKIAMSSLMIRRNILINIFNGNIPNYFIIEDLDIISKSIRYGKLKTINQPLMYYRIHETNFSKKNNLLEEELLHWIDVDNNYGISEKDYKSKVKFCKAKIINNKQFELLESPKKSLKEKIRFYIKNNFFNFYSLFILFFPKFTKKKIRK